MVRRKKENIGCEESKMRNQRRRVAIARAWRGPENLELCDTECLPDCGKDSVGPFMVEYSMMPSSWQCSVTSAAAIQ